MKAIRKIITKIVFGTIASGFFVLTALVQRWKKAGKITKYVATPAIIALLISGSVFTYLTIVKEEPAGAVGENWLTGYDYRQQIDIDPSKIDDDLTNFPVAVMFSSSTVDFTHFKDSGEDVRFTSSDGETLIDFENERWASTTDGAYLWVEIPSVSSSSAATTTFYMYYGNDDASDAASSTAVWDSNFIAVHHLVGAAYTDLDDSTANNNDISVENGSPTGYNTDAKIGKGIGLDGDDDYVSAPDSASLDSITTGITLEFWMSSDDLSSGDGLVGKYWDGSNGAWGFNIEASEEIRLALTNGAGDNKTLLTTTDFNLTTTTWYNIVAAWDTAGDTMRIYKNGVVSANTAAKTANIYTSNIPFEIGFSSGQATTKFDGILDEVRVSDIDRGAAWIKASYNSGNDSLLSIGSEEEEEAPAVRRIMIID